MRSLYTPKVKQHIIKQVSRKDFLKMGKVNNKMKWRSKVFIKLTLTDFNLVNLNVQFKFPIYFHFFPYQLSMKNLHWLYSVKSQTENLKLIEIEILGI